MKRHWVRVLLVTGAAGCTELAPTPTPDPPPPSPPNTGIRSIAVIPDNIVVEVGDTVRFSASGSGGLTIGSCRWQSSDSAVATVDSTALGRAAGHGAALIRATCVVAGNGSASGGATLNVR
ncbi:MAG: Ig-like domain-containing protein [Gemmatimonadales bacterium]